MSARVCMVAYTRYDTDNRVRRYAESLVRNGYHVDIIALRYEGESKIEMRNGVRVYRIQTRPSVEKTKIEYLFRLLKFLFRSMVYVARISKREPFQLVHVHSVPDFEVFSASIPKLKGARVILDIHDILPEFYASKFKVSQHSTIFKLLTIVERLSIVFSDHVIIANDIWRKTLLERSVTEKKCTTILNYPDPAIFSRKTKENRNQIFTFFYPGSLNRHQGLDIAIRAFARIKDEVPHARFDILGSGRELTILSRLIQEFGLEDRVSLKKPVRMEAVAKLMVQADVGVVPKRNDIFSGDAFSTKILEFMLSGTPVIVSKTRIDDYYFNDSVVMFFEPENEEELAQCMVRLATDKKMRRQLAENAYQFVQEMNWAKKEYIYLDLVSRLLKRRK